MQVTQHRLNKLEITEFNKGEYINKIQNDFTYMMLLSSDTEHIQNNMLGIMIKSTLSTYESGKLIILH
jgi:hypothetical protein